MAPDVMLMAAIDSHGTGGTFLLVAPARAAPARAAAPLATVKEFMADDNAVIVMVVLLLGVNLIGNGMAGLSA